MSPYESYSKKKFVNVSKFAVRTDTFELIFSTKRYLKRSS